MKSPVLLVALPVALLSLAVGLGASCSSSPPIYPLIDGGQGGAATTTAASTTASASSSSTTSTSASGSGTGGSCGGESKCGTAADCPSLSTKCLSNTCSFSCCGVSKAAAGTACNDNGGKLCNATGTCIACAAASDCPASTTTCATPTCTTAGACVNAPAAKGTLCSDNGGTACDGKGNCTTMHCTDGIQDADETSVDCGGTACAPCADNQGCKIGPDCVDKVCKGNPPTCQAPSCMDGAQNGMETDVDCGGPVCSACLNTKKCALNTDCASASCIGGVCAAASCSDGIQNGSETSIDCGGPDCPHCGDGKSCCLGTLCSGTNCLDKVCMNGTCAAPTCNDLVQNGAETDVDCGGGTCPACNPGKKCSTPTDCVGMSCESTCQCPSGMIVTPIAGGKGIYCIDTNEVSYGQYQVFYDANPPTSQQPPGCTFNTDWTPKGNWPQPLENATLPVDYVNWCQAYAYCAYMSRRLCGNIGNTGDGSVPQASFADFTADEWYNACTAGGNNTYPYPGGYDGSRCNGHDIADGGSPGPLSYQSLPNCIGGETSLLEMSGNVAEWENSCNASVGGSDLCAVRGGSYEDTMSGLRCDSGQTGLPLTKARNYVGPEVGFRCCL